MALLLLMAIDVMVKILAQNTAVTDGLSKIQKRKEFKTPPVIRYITTGKYKKRNSRSDVARLMMNKSSAVRLRFSASTIMTSIFPAVPTIKAIKKHNCLN